MEDFEAVRDACRTCREVGAATRSEAAQVKYNENYLRDSILRGWTPAMPQIYDIELAAGRHITEGDVRAAAPVCTVGWDVQDFLFAGSDPIGKEVRVDGEPCEVIGVGKKLGSAFGNSRDNWVILPITLVQRRYGSRETIRVWAKAYSPERLNDTIDEVRQIMRGRRHLAYTAKDDFAVETNASLLSVWSGISSAFFGVVVIIASISLVVGGIVIMNIMLVSVTERTREIGLRKSIGARRSDILLQFLIESSTIAAIGGLWGVAGGVLLAELVSWVTPLPSAVKLWSVAAGLLVSTFVGLFFGIYPASKAAKLDPVEALRAE
jgi:putative ABC transport system permease protein